MPNASALRWLWRERLESKRPIDRSGVWRFRELLPILEYPDEAVTLREGNTPLYKLFRTAEKLGLEELYVKHQGMNPTGSFKDTGMTAALSVARERGFEWVACASTGKYVGGHGGLCGARRNEEPGFASGRKNLMA